MKALLAVPVILIATPCAGLSNRDPLVVDVAGIGPLRGVGFMENSATDEIDYRISSKLEGGMLGTRRFRDEGTFALSLPGP